jgi:hypothetical protein
MALPVCVGLAIGMGLTMTLIVRSAAGPVTVSPRPGAPASASPPPAPADPVAPSASRPARAPQGPPRPESGTEIGTRGPAGRGALTIRSGLAADAIVELVHDAGHRRRIYLRRGEQITMLDLVPGSYQLRFAAGTGWTGRWFAETSVTVERIAAMTIAPVESGARADTVTLVFGDPGLRSTSLLQPD